MKHAILIQQRCSLFYVTLLPAQLVFSFFEPIIEFAVWYCFYAKTASILAVLECMHCDNNNNKIFCENMSGAGVRIVGLADTREM